MESFARKRHRPEEWEDIQASKVVHIRELCEHTLEIDIARALEHFGTIQDIAMIPKRRQALVEFEDISSAQDVVNMFRNEVMYIANKPAKVNFSTSEHVVKRSGVPNEITSVNKVLIFFIYEAVYPITVDVITKICKPHGRVVRIFINRRAQILQALVEFMSVEDALNVKRNLNGADIYSGCCTLKIEFATTNHVNVSSNTEDSWDYDNPPPINNNARHSLLGVPNSPRDMSQRSGMSANRPNRGIPMYENDFTPEMGSYDDGSSNQRHQMFERPMPFPPYHEMHHNGGNMMAGPCVAMVYGLNLQKLNCDKLFNLLCIYGNVIKVKFLKSKEGSAMVQMGDEEAMHRMMTLLYNQTLFDNDLQFQVSKQPTITDVPVPYLLPDGSPSFKDYSFCKENRFNSPEMAEKNRVFPPSMTVNYWNAPPHFNFDLIKEEFTKLGAATPAEFHQLTDRPKSSSGLLQWTSTEEATNAVALCNHVLIQSEGSKFPYMLKLSFSESPIRHGAVRSEIGDGVSRDTVPFSRRSGGGFRGGMARGTRGARTAFPRRGRV